MKNIDIDKLKDYVNNSATIIQILVLPMVGMFMLILASNKIVSGDTARQLNIAFIHTVILAYTHAIVPFAAIWTTSKDILKFRGIEHGLLKVVISSISIFATMAVMFCNFQLSLGFEILNTDTCIYYTAVLMIEFIAIAFFIIGAYLLGNWLVGILDNKIKKE